jgi:hypothetical protein
MDFYQIRTKEVKNENTVLYPDFNVGRSKDLMVRGRSFYAVWDEARGMWSTDEYDIVRLMDEELRAYAEHAKDTNGTIYTVKNLFSFGSNSWNQFRRFIGNISDNSHQLDEQLTFADTEVKRTDYVSRRLPYSLEPGDHSAWDELVGTLYSADERAKIEWGIGAIVSGDSKKIQKFLVFYGPPASGKSTILNIVEKLFVGYTTTFEAKALGSSNNSFSTEVFKNDPLVAIQHDGDLSKIDDNAKLNSIVSHEEMTMNEKFKASYTSRVNAFLLMGTNQPVRISDAKAGIIRRLIDIHPTGVRLSINHYHTLMTQIDFELGAIAHHCLETYREMGKNYYNGYRPLEMMLQTDVFFNFIEAYYDVFKAQDGISLTQAYLMYKEFCSESGIEKMLPRYKFREELRNYFDEFKDRILIDDILIRSYYKGFNANKFKIASKTDTTFSLVMDETVSIFDDEYANQPAQYANAREMPSKYWTDDPKLINGELKAPKESQIVKTVLGELDTSLLHFVKVPENHIVIDFDLKDENGTKSLERNLEAASNWPATYAELSKGGSGVHLHYNYEGDTSELSSTFSEGIEVKSLLGDASLRRRLSKCNNVPVAIIKGGLPVKEKKMINIDKIQSEKGLRDLIARNLRKEIHPGTKSSIDFIYKILEDAYASGLSYDVTDLYTKIMAFANSSTNQPFQSLKVVQKMRFQSEEKEELSKEIPTVEDDRIVIFDVEVYPNLFVVCWKYKDSDVVVRMINPTAQDIEKLLKLKLVGFNNRRYDNHIIYARYMGYTNEQLFNLSQKMIVEKNRGSMFGEAYNLSYADVWDFMSDPSKPGLKICMIRLGMIHLELDLPWDQPVPEERWPDVADYCANDVNGTEAVFDDKKQDFVARQILADLSGLSVNDTTQKHTARIIFGNDRNPQTEFNHPDLREEFPGYVFELGKSYYRDEMPGEGGYNHAEPGIYENVAVLDIASMHPTTIEQLNVFGGYTPKFSALKAARIAIKHGDYNAAKKMLDGKLAPYLLDSEQADALAYALKVVVNIVYGLTSAKFDNPFRDIRNVDNVVAKRGALFMIDLKHAVQEQGFIVAHIKTDSIKIPNATPEIIDFVMNFGSKYGYDFEHEATYEKFCLINDAVFIAKDVDKWKAVGAQFQHPYVYKILFSGEKIKFDDMCETKHVIQGAMYLDFEHDRPMVMAEGMHFVGRTGRFIPVEEGQNGGRLFRVNNEKVHSVSGTKGYLWMESVIAESMGDSLRIDMSYFDRLIDAAKGAINNFGDFEEFIN